MTGVDLMWLALNAYHEARGESFDGQVAVCHVVLNRAANRRQTIKDVILDPWDFSWCNDGARPPVKNYEAFESCIKAADQAANRERPQGSNLQGADHYYAWSGPGAIKEPWWVKKGKMQEVAKIGHHIFYRS